MEARGAYFESCPNCGGPEGDDRLHRYHLACPKCLPRRLPVESVLDLAKLLREAGTLREESEVARLARVEEEASEAEAIFEKATGARLWSAQRMWVRRVLKGKSFAVIAPTGVGKTTFGCLMAVYFPWRRGLKSYIVLPTTPLVEQVEERARRIAEGANLEVRVLAIHSRMTPAERKRRLKAFLEGDFDVLVTTSRFMMQRLRDILLLRRSGKFNLGFMFVDDVDAVLKSGKSVDAVLKIVGFDDEAISLGWELLKLEREVARLPRRLQELVASGRMSKEEAARRMEELRRRIAELQAKLEEYRRRAAVLVVSSATGRPRGSRVRLFRVLLGFEAGGAAETLRNVVDSYIIPEDASRIDEYVIKVVSRLGDGGLVYVPVDLGSEYAEKLAEELKAAGVAAEAFTARNPGALERFRRGETQVLVGVATYYGVMVRGLDLPERVRYAVFAGVPRHKFSARLDKPTPSSILRALSILAEYAPSDVAEKARQLLARCRRLVQRLSQAALQRLTEELQSGEARSEAAKLLLEALEFAREALSRSDVWEALEKAEDISIRREGGVTYILVPDVATYIQASGRTSRMYAGGITKGLSVVVADDVKLLNGLIRRTKWWYDAEWTPFDKLDLSRILREIDEDRKRVRELLQGKLKPGERELVVTALLVVESPNKARTIARFFGRPSVRTLGPLRVYEVSTGDYILLVTASGGHVYDLVSTAKPRLEVDFKWLLPQVEGSVEGVDWSRVVNFHGVVVDDAHRVYLPLYSSLKRCLVCGHQWAWDPSDPSSASRCPRCGSTLIKSSSSIVAALRDLASEVDVVLVGTDPDTEGEKIGWDIASLVAPTARGIRRIEFHEVTRKAIEKAIHEARSFNENLVEAQIVRRVEDRWVGFSLSARLWVDFWLHRFCPKKLKSLKQRARWDRKAREALEVLEKACREPNFNLSAGRVQTPVLGWIVERTKEFKRNVQKVYTLTLENGLTIELRSKDDLGGAEPSTSDFKRAKVKIEVLKREVVEVHPPPPYTTDAMLADAAARLGLSAPNAMRLAQDLFELGFITYHRTDSTRVSDAGIAVAREYIRERFGEKWSELFVPRKWGEGGAHECIRPVRPVDADRLRSLIAEGVVQPARPLTRRHLELYDLIFRRFIASQMRSGKVEVVNARITIELPSGLSVSKEVELRVKVVEPGFMLVYQPFKLDPDVASREYQVRSVRSRRWSSVPPYTQSDVLRLMKERGIGRPSTYAKIIDTLLRRKYVKMVGKRGYLIATSRGIEVYRYLIERFRELVSEEATRRLEETMDAIEQGLRDYREVLHEILEELAHSEIEEAARVLQLTSRGG